MTDAAHSPLREARLRRGWTQLRVVIELEAVARAEGVTLGAERSSLLRMLGGRWEKGRPVDTRYQRLFCIVFDCSPAELGFEEPFPELPAATGELHERLALGATVDAGLVELLRAQTHNLRLLDRRLGAGQLLAQTAGHVDQMRDLLRYSSLAGGYRPMVAVALTEAASLAGWQALDLGRLDDAWRHYDTARVAALESDSAPLLAHVTAEAAYVLLEMDRTGDALDVIRHALSRQRAMPVLLRSWLHAAEAEACAADGQDQACREALDAAAAELPEESADPEFPFIVLDPVHLSRWRGNCLARLGADDAVDELEVALARLDSSFTRAEAGLRCDLALALAGRGDRRQARSQALRAAELAGATCSARQRRRIDRVLSA